MSYRLNVNMVLCQKYNNETKTINKIFNEITTNDKHEVSFSIITFVNGVGHEQPEERFVLHYFLVEKNADYQGKRLGLYLGATGFYRNNQEGYDNERCLSSTDNTFAEMAFENVPFLKETEYCIEVYKAEGTLEGDYETLREKAQKLKETTELISYVSFNVNYPKM